MAYPFLVFFDTTKDTSPKHPFPKICIISKSEIDWPTLIEIFGLLSISMIRKFPFLSFVKTLVDIYPIIKN